MEGGISNTDAVLAVGVGVMSDDDRRAGRVAPTKPPAPPLDTGTASLPAAAAAATEDVEFAVAVEEEDDECA